MTYLYRFLIKVILSILLILRSFSLFTYSLYVQGGGYWVLPLITIMFVVWTVIEYVSLSKSKMWYKSVRDKDERVAKHVQRAGYITFWINIIGTALLFVFYSYVDISKINPLNFIGIIFIISIVSFITLKTYFIHEK
ncbi:hypothetical protein [Clostridium sp.]|jgi:uncharacterized membrane protein|uniref:hypothetical protein n=1 Tax=Clostridium sp. TaxID=1506 RepID=UPI003EED1C07